MGFVYIGIYARDIVYSIDEWAYYDLPAMIDFICDKTKYEKLYLVSYSLSSSVFLSTASARPEYNDKIIVSYHLAPFVAFTNIKSVLLRLAVQFGEFYLVGSTAPLSLMKTRRIPRPIRKRMT